MRATARGPQAGSASGLGAGPGLGRAPGTSSCARNDSERLGTTRNANKAGLVPARRRVGHMGHMTAPRWVGHVPARRWAGRAAARCVARPRAPPPMGLQGPASGRLGPSPRRLGPSPRRLLVWALGRAPGTAPCSRNDSERLGTDSERLLALTRNDLALTRNGLALTRNDSELPLRAVPGRRAAPILAGSGCGACLKTQGRPGHRAAIGSDGHPPRRPRARCTAGQEAGSCHTSPYWRQRPTCALRPADRLP